MRGLHISPGFWLTVGGIWLVEPELLAPALFAAAVHECGHLIALALVGGRAEGFTLAASGAQIWLGGGLSYARELPVALGGPLASLALALILANCARFLAAGLSLALGLFNLLPLPPLDGGRVVSCLGGIFLPPLAAERLSQTLSAVTLSGLVALGLASLRAGFGVPLLTMALWLGWRTLSRPT